MTRGRIPDVEIVDPPKQSQPPELSIEERILGVRDKFYSEKSRDLERLITDELEHNFDKLVLAQLGLERDRWDMSSYRYNFSHTNRDYIQTRAKEVADSILAKIEFDKIELTTSQLNAIKSAYQSELKAAVTDAARQLARQDALGVAAKILGIELEDE